MKIRQSQLWIRIGLFAILAIALLLRMNGLFRGLAGDFSFHPDVPKQITALGNFLQGNYVWYVGSLFYDGYPLGLNHLDEYLLRLVFLIQQAGSSLVSPEALPLVQPEKISLYYGALCLRVLYSLCCLGILYKLTYHLLQSRGTALAALLLAAISPLAIVVSHIATGDIGVDLFTLLALGGLCLYAHGNRIVWLFWAGVATGLAFSCKYQGALTGIPIGLFILLEFTRERRVVKALKLFCLSAVGGFLGILAGTPAAFINWGRTWKYMRANFEFIQHYNVKPEFLAQPWETRVTTSLSGNTPIITHALGWILTLLALTGLFFAARHFLKSRQGTGPDALLHRKTSLILALLAFPFLALLISLVGKPEVQPFHFSYLQAPLIFGAVYALHTLWRHPRRPAQILAVILLILAVSESAYVTKREAFFWGRSDNLHWAEHMAGNIQEAPYSSTNTLDIVKNIYLEPGTLAIFRNKASVVSVPNAAFWNQLHIAPIPTVPFSMDQDWLFPNGPVFPLNDRSFKTSRDRTSRRHVVMYSTPATMKFGLRSGSLPVQIALSYGHEPRLVTLTPNSQETITLTPKQWKHSRGNHKNPNCFLVPLDVAAKGGNAWITVLADERETRVFDFYGGLIQEREHIVPTDIPTPQQQEILKSLRYLEGEESVSLVPSEHLPYGYRFPKEGLALPCGPYVLECVLQCQTPSADITLKVDDLLRCKELTPLESALHLEAGYQVITSRFSKAFAPYEAQLELKVLSGRCRLERWTIHPDVTQIQQDLQEFVKNGTPPTWLSRGHGTNAPAPVWDKAPIIFGDRIRLSRLAVPATISRRDNVYITCEMVFEKFGIAHIDDYVFFIHLLDANGHTVHTFNMPLWQTFALGSLNVPFRFEPLTHLSPGEYRLELGIDNARIGKRLPVEMKDLSKQERAKRNHVFGRITVTD